MGFGLHVQTGCCLFVFEFPGSSSLGFVVYAPGVGGIFVLGFGGCRFRAQGAVGLSETHRLHLDCQLARAPRTWAQRATPSQIVKTKVVIAF